MLINCWCQKTSGIAFHIVSQFRQWVCQFCHEAHVRRVMDRISMAKTVLACTTHALKVHKLTQNQVTLAHLR